MQSETGQVWAWWVPGESQTSMAKGILQPPLGGHWSRIQVRVTFGFTGQSAPLWEAYSYLNSDKLVQTCDDLCRPVNRSGARWGYRPLPACNLCVNCKNGRKSLSLFPGCKLNTAFKPSWRDSISHHDRSCRCLHFGLTPSACYQSLFLQTQSLQLMGPPRVLHLTEDLDFVLILFTRCLLPVGNVN